MKASNDLIPTSLRLTGMPSSVTATDHAAR